MMKGKHNMMRRKKGTEGLTLIELVVVMCILAVMVMISIPNIGRWLPRYRLRSAVRDVASSMQLARLGAIKNNREWAIVFDLSNPNDQQYRIVHDDGPDNTWGTNDDVGYRDIVGWQGSTTSITGYRSNVSFGDDGHGPWPGGQVVGGDGITFDQVQGFNDRYWVKFKPDGTAGPDPDNNGIVGSAYLQNNRGGASCARIRFTATGAIEVVHWDGDSWE
jgi:Tfp pilus assembly protein FimT